MYIVRGKHTKLDTVRVVSYYILVTKSLRISEHHLSICLNIWSLLLGFVPIPTP